MSITVRQALARSEFEHRLFVLGLCQRAAQLVILDIDMAASGQHLDAALANGHDLYSFRYAANDNANSLYYREAGESVVVVSEPLDADRAHWKPVPPGYMICARAGAKVALEPFLPERRIAAE